MKKILIIPGGLQMGGAEKVAAEVCCYAPKGEFEFQYLVFEGEENVYGPEIETHGGKVFYWPSPSENYGAYIRNLDKLMAQEHYTAVHSHTMFNSGINLWIAKRNHVPVRIAHSHTTKTEHTVSAAQTLYESLMRKSIQHFATHCFACGEAAGEWLFGNKVFSRRGKVIHNGIDTEEYRFSEENRQKIRAQLHLENRFLIGHSGTLIPLKNQEFLIRLLPEICKKIPNAELLLLGAGTPEEIARLKQIISDNRMEEHVILCGGVRNVHEYLSALDAFAFPSLREGTPLALLEAQANGLPCIVSDAVPMDAFVTDQIVPLSLQNSGAWVDAICSAQRENAPTYASLVRQCGYDVHETYDPVYRVYRNTEKALFAFSFDDGRADNFRAAQEIIAPCEFPATFNITTGYVDGTCPPDLRPSSAPAMNVAQVQKLAENSKFEIALHGNNHLNTVEDIDAGREKILQWLGKDSTVVFGFASPGSGLETGDRSFLSREPFRSGISYARVGLRYQTLKPLRVLARKAGRVLHWSIFFRFSYADTLMSRSDGRILYSVPVMGDITASQVISLIQLCIRRRQAIILMLHSVEDQPYDTWSWETERFRNLCCFLEEKQKAGQLDVLTVAQLYEKIK